MVNNDSTGSLCSVAKLEAYWNASGNLAPMRKMKDQYAVSAHGRSWCIGIETFRFTFGDCTIAFDAPMMETTALLWSWDLAIKTRLDPKNRIRRAITLYSIVRFQFPLPETEEYGDVVLLRPRIPVLREWSTQTASPFSPSGCSSDARVP